MIRQPSPTASASSSTAAGIIAATLLVVSCAFPAGAVDNRGGWRALVDNDPFKACEIFAVNAGDAGRSGAEACKGLAEVAAYLGQDRQASGFFIKGCLKDLDPIEASAGLLYLATFARNSGAKRNAEGYELLKKLTRAPGLFAGQFCDLLVERSVNDGNVGSAEKIVKSLGCIRTWQCIGPFDNTSNAGFNNVYPPESAVDLSKTYAGKDGNGARWFPLTSQDHRGWIFLEHHTGSYDAVYYCYCTVYSPETRRAGLAFGSSSSFKVMLNGALVLADSVFRNTGSDVFIQQVILRKGPNALLVKLCHESGNKATSASGFSNFSLRFVDTAYRALTDVRIAAEPATVAASSETPASLAPTPLIDSVAHVLGRRLAADSGDLRAALLLEKLYNVAEMTDSAQLLAQRYVKRFPRSSLWQQTLSESFVRAMKITEAQTALKTAYRLSPLNYDAWANEMAQTAKSGNAQQTLAFLEASPQAMKSTVSALLYKTAAYASLDNRAEAVTCLLELEKQGADNYTAVETLAGFYAEQGMSGKAEKLLRGYLKRGRSQSAAYDELSRMAVRQGNPRKALRVMDEELEYCPDEPNVYYQMADLLYGAKRYADGLRAVEQCLALMPASADALNLKGNILVSLGEPRKAKTAFTDAILYTNDDFNAWENIRALDKKPSLETLAPMPPVDSIIAASKGWDGLGRENGAIISYITDVFYYPSRCSRERTFMVVRLPTQKAVDSWKEQEIGYNGYFQVLAVNRALSRHADGTEVPADIDDNKVVYKSLQAGDDIVLEYSLKNYYTGEMANQVYGSESFQLASPVFDRRLRLVTPTGDTIPYNVCGDSIAVSTATHDDYRTTVFSRAANKAAADETFMATDWPGKRLVTYSTIGSWAAIVDWYRGLTRHKHDNSLELAALADSLFAGCAEPSDKVRKVHEFITSAIRYSFVPFRQSGWTPQPARTVLATRLGDCKDMASLAKSLLDRAGIPCDLVLVNTGVRHYTGHACVSPDFNHCILGYAVDGRQRFLDLTDPNLSASALPATDQGALALVIRDGNSEPIALPMDSASSRGIVRRVSSVLDTTLTLREQVRTVRTGVPAGLFRSWYRFLSPQECATEMRKSLAGDYPDLVVDSLALGDLMPTCDSLPYVVKYTAKNAAVANGNTAIFSPRFSDKVEAKEYPLEEKRTTPVDLYLARYDIGTFDLKGELTFPRAWRPISLPPEVRLDSPWGSYQLTFSQRGNVISYSRQAAFRFYQPVPVIDFEKLRDFLRRVSQADATQLLFFVR